MTGTKTTEQGKGLLKAMREVGTVGEARRIVADAMAEFMSGQITAADMSAINLEMGRINARVRSEARRVQI